MRKSVRNYINACLSCQYYKQASGKREGLLHPIEKTPVSFYPLHVDHLGSFITSKKGNKYLVVVFDGFTKYVIMEPVKDTRSKHVIRVFMDITYLFGAPVRIISDRGLFTTKVFSLFCQNYCIRHVLNDVFTPRANGQCERYNRIIITL